MFDVSRVFDITCLDSVLPTKREIENPTSLTIKTYRKKVHNAFSHVKLLGRVKELHVTGMIQHLAIW